MRHPRFGLFISVLVALVFASGCRSRQAKAPASIKHDRISLVGVMKRMDARRKAISTIITQMKFVFHDRSRNRKIGLNGNFFGGQHGNMRMRIKRGESVVIDMAFRGDQVEMYLPRKKRFSKGSRTDVWNSENNVLALLAHIGYAPELFFPRCWTRKAIQRRARLQNGQEVVRVLEASGSSRRVARRFYINPSQPVCDRVEVLNERGTLMGTVRFEDYFFPDASAEPLGEREVHIAYPRQVTLETPDNQRTLSMEVNKILHQEMAIPESKFVISPPDDVEVRNLGQTLSSGKGLWE